MAAASSPSTTRRGGRRRTVVAVVLASLAVGGVGAAATSAAWTDNTFFAAPAAGATFDLQGSLDGSTWKQSDNAASVELQVPASVFANITPGDTKTVTLHLKNTGSLPANLVLTSTWGTGFTGNPAVSNTLPAKIAAGSGDVSFTVSITAPANWDIANQGRSATLALQIQGTTTAS